MARGLGDEELSVMEAVDNLSNMSEIDLKSPIDIETDEEISHEINWRDPRQALRNEPTLKETFRVIHRYLQNIIRTGAAALKEPTTQKGIQAIMVIAAEAVAKMDRYVALYPDQYKPISKLKEYQDLQKYYRQQILNQMPRPREVSEEWEDSLKEGLEGIEGLEAQKRGLKDLEAVRNDQNYELFFIKNENNRPYFTRNLLRHIRLIGNFDELISKVEGEDPLIKIRELLDRELYEGAKEALQSVAPYLDEFYKEGMKHKNKAFVAALNKAVMALRMAANPKNLIENESFKSCLEYYSDFHLFLRKSMEAPGYRKRIQNPTDDPFSHSLLNLTHALCCYFFMRVEPRKEALSLIHKLIEDGEKLRSPYEKPQPEENKLAFWTDMIDVDENIRYLLKHYPNGPLMRTLDAFREEEEFEGFDPLSHQNFPSQLFTFSQDPFHVTILRMPCPTKQTYINKSDVVKEFMGFLRFYKHELKPDLHLIVNLQDRTSWDAYNRCITLEKFTKKAEYTDAMSLLGLVKDGDFYQQNGAYGQVGGAPVFMEQFEEQILSGVDCGFYGIPTTKTFVKKALKVVHEAFFEGKTTLSRLERMHFIEIFYQLLILKAIEETKCDSISFSCKDALDTGAAESALFYGFLRLLSDAKDFSKEEKDRLLWMFYSPALLIRERCIDPTRLKRAILALETVHKALLGKRKEVLKAINGLYSKIKFPFNIA